MSEWMEHLLDFAGEIVHDWSAILARLCRRYGAWSCKHLWVSWLV